MISTITWVLVLLWTTAKDIEKAITTSYQQEWVASMCVEHMKANNNQWPRSWDDVRDDYQTIQGAGESGRSRN